MKKFILQEDTLQGILNYLATKPYNEVTDFILAIQTATPLEATKDLTVKGDKNKNE